MGVSEDIKISLLLREERAKRLKSVVSETLEILYLKHWSLAILLLRIV